MRDLATVSNRGPVYDERLGVPLRWWAQGTAFVATFWVALAVAMPLAWSYWITAAVLVLMALAFAGYGSARVVVGDGWFRAGSARIEASYLGVAVALDAEATQRTAGRDADARAFLLLRPYLKRAVKVEIVDPADPTPYWLVSTRHPDGLVSALTSLSQHQ